MSSTSHEALNDEESDSSNSFHAESSSQNQSNAVVDPQLTEDQLEEVFKMTSSFRLPELDYEQSIVFDGFYDETDFDSQDEG